MNSWAPLCRLRGLIWIKQPPAFENQIAAKVMTVDAAVTGACEGA